MLEKSFPLACQYPKEWVLEHSYDGLTLLCTESLCQILDLKKGMRILDLGCGKAISSIFLAREFQVEVWAVDKEVSPSSNYQLIKEACLENTIFPLRADAKHLPFAESFFDAILSVDAYSYFGMDERFLPYLLSFLNRSGQIGILDGCFREEIHFDVNLPPYLQDLYWDEEDPWYPVHSPDWWVPFMEKTGLVKVEHCEILPETKDIWDEYIENNRHKPGEQVLIQSLKNDRENLLGLFRLTARKK